MNSISPIRISNQQQLSFGNRKRVISNVIRATEITVVETAKILPAMSEGFSLRAIAQWKMTGDLAELYARQLIVKIAEFCCKKPLKKETIGCIYKASPLNSFNFFHLLMKK